MSEFVLGLTSNQIDRRVLLDLTDASSLGGFYQLSSALTNTSFSVEALNASLSNFSTTSFSSANVLPTDTSPIFNNMENDDFADDMTTTGILEVDGTANGVIDFNGDSDWFAIDLTAGEIIRVAAAGFDVELVLRDEFGGALAFSDIDFNSDDTFVIAEVAESGTYYVDVSSFFDTLDYTLTATTIEDDFTADTNTSGVLEVGGTASGNFDYVGDRDWFAIDLTAGEIVRVSTTDFDIDLVLRDEFGNSLAFGDIDFNTDETFLIAEVAESGTYYVDVSHFFDTVNYTITATTQPDDFASDVSTTGILELNGTTTGRIDYFGDRDWFAIELTAGDIVRIATDGFDSELAFRNELGNALSFSLLDFNTNETFLLAQIVESGTYYVDITNFFETTDYTLTATAIVDDFAGDTSTMGVLEVGGMTTGAIDFRADSDWFAIELTAGEIIRIASNDTDVDLALRDEFGSFIAGDFRDFNTNESIIFAQVSESGIYYVDVTGSNSSLDYTLTAAVQTDDFTADTSTTGVLVLDGTTTGVIDFTNDSDWFEIELTAGEVLNVVIDDFNTDLTLRNEFGDFIASHIRNFSANETSLTAQVQESGTYYLDVSGFNSPTAYTLTSTLLPDDFGNGTSTAGVLQIGGTVNGAIEYRDDSDWFAIDLTVGEVIRIALNRTSPDVFLRDEFGNVLNFASVDFEAGESIIVAEVGETGTYYVDVTGSGILDYTLTAVVQPDDFAGNTSTTGVLEAGGTSTGVIDYAGDRDWFALNITDTDLDLRLLVDGNGVNLSVYDANGDFVTFSDQDSIEFSEVGTYFVETAGVFADAGDYTISAIVVGSVDANLRIADTDVIDTVTDEVNNITYSLSRDGTLIRDSNNTDTLLPNIDLGVDTSALSVSLDGRHIFVAQADLENVGNNDYEATVFRIDAETLEIESFSFEVTRNGYVIRDIQAAADGSLFVTTDFPGSGFVPLLNLSGFDTTLSVNVINAPEFSGFNQISDRSTLDISQDGQFLLLAESNISSYPVHIFSIAAREIIASINHGGFNRDRNAISGEAELVLVESTLYDFDFNVLADLSYIFSGSVQVEPVFSKNGDYLFLVNEAFNGDTSIAVVSTSSFEIVSFVDVTQDFSDIQEVDISLDGLSIIVTDTVGVHYVDFSDTALSINGTASADRFVGTEFDELISGFEGDDFLDGAGGDDTLLGAEGNDTLVGGAGDDTLSGGEGNDRLFSGAGDDIVEGGLGDDQILGGSGNDSLFGGYGDDMIDGGASDDMIDGGIGADTLFGGNGNDLILGGMDNDILRGDAGNDRLEGGQGDDFLGGNAGNDLLIGGSGNDRLLGASGQDVLFGQQGDDLLFGGGGNDRLVGASGDDTLYGQNGDDTLEGGSGSDTLTGGLDADLFVVIQPSATTTITDFTDGEDMLDLSDFDDADIQSALDGASQQGTDTVLTFSNGSVIVLENFDLNDLSDEDIADFDMGMIA